LVTRLEAAQASPILGVELILSLPVRCLQAAENAHLHLFVERRKSCSKLRLH
jgi:hypothetical protein